MGENTLDLQYRFFVVGKRPFCIWGTDISSLALEFLDGVDPTYFEYIADTHLQHIREDQPREKESQFAALAIRGAYSQALETLFALLGASVQAPQCVHAWIDNYQPRELYSLVRRIHNRQPIASLVNVPVLTWPVIAETLLTWLVLEDKEREATIKKHFANLWSSFASKFLDEHLSEEYNSIKHGLRVRSGGFHIAMGVETQPGVPAPKENMRIIGKSEFGSRYFASQKIGEVAHHLQMKRHHRNWSPEDLSWSLHLASLSIANIKAALQILNGIPPTEVKFQYPTDDEIFQEPRKREIQIGVTHMSGFNINILPDFINPFTKDEILMCYQSGKDAGVRRITFLGEAKTGGEEDAS